MLATRVRRAAVLLVAAVVCVGVATPATAHHKEGHAGGPGSQCEQPNYPPKQCQDQAAATSSSRMQRGDTFTLYVQGYAPGSLTTVTLYSDPVRLGAGRADEFAFLSLPLTIPRDTPLGDHHVTAEGVAVDGAPLRLSVPITVIGSVAVAGAPDVDTGGAGRPAAGGSAGDTAGDPGTGSETLVLGVSLPRTGTAVASIGVAGALLVVLGGVLLQAGRRHRPSPLD